MGPDYWLASPYRAARLWLTAWWRRRRTDWNGYHPLDDTEGNQR